MAWSEAVIKDRDSSPTGEIFIRTMESYLRQANPFMGFIWIFGPTEKNTTLYKYIGDLSEALTKKFPLARRESVSQCDPEWLEDARNAKSEE